MSALAPPAPDLETDGPRALRPGASPSDHVFRSTVRVLAMVVLALTLAIGLFLGYQAFPTLHHYGFGFFTRADWQPERDTVGLAGVLVGTVEVAVIALAIGFPLALFTALFITEYAPTRLRAGLVSLVDLMAAVPSIVYGLWALLVLEPHALYVARWLSQNFGWVPIFRADTNPNAAVLQPSRFTASAFIAGLAVSLMVIPLACAVMRGVFAEVPRGEREAAMALGATRWGVVRTVVLPFGRRGIVGGAMLGLGRALGETIVVLLIISPVFEIKWRVLTVGTMTTSALIADRFGEATSSQLSALLAAGFVLFLITLGVNTVAARIVSRGRDAAASEA
jgi:phosphate transport system permease protein